MRRRLPLLPVVRREVKGKDDKAAEVPDFHFTPIATRESDGARGGFMSGDIMMASAHMGLECVATTDGVRLMVGDTAMVRLPAFGNSPHPCRIAAIFWQNTRKQRRRALELSGGNGGGVCRWFQALDTIDEEDEDAGSSPSSTSTGASWQSSEEDGEEEEEEEEEEEAEEEGEDETQQGRPGGGVQSTGHLVVRVNPFVFRSDMPDGIKSKRRRDQDVESVWEVTNQEENVGVSALVLVRGRLQGLILDSPEHSDRTNTKNANGCTLRSCQRCKVPRRHLGNPRYDIRQNRRTAEGVDANIEYVKQGATKTEGVERAKQRGVVVPKVSKKLTFDRQLQIPFDILHADSLVCRAFRDLMEACSASTFMVRLGSYTDAELRVLEKWQREQVKLEFHVCYV
ncbi:unnamed protein product [Ectocarpus sp. CCAP 1310/34]|nr:unnamed protein product [Ectocarpus sp. CCAP 1310/34]